MGSVHCISFKERRPIVLLRWQAVVECSYRAERVYHTSHEGVNRCFAKAEGLSNLDVNGAYWQVSVDEADWDKTTFTLHHGL